MHYSYAFKMHSLLNYGQFYLHNIITRPFYIFSPLKFAMEILNAANIIACYGMQHCNKVRQPKKMKFTIASSHLILWSHTPNILDIS